MAYAEDKNQTGVPKGKVRYRFYIRIDGDRRRNKVTCEPSKVEAKYQEWERKNLRTPETTKSLPLFEILDEYLEHSRQIKSVNAYWGEKYVIEKLIKVYFNKNTKLQSIKRMHIEDYIKWRRHVCNHRDNVKEKVSNATINRDLSLLSYFFNYCIVRELYHRTNPVYKQKLKENNIREVRLSREQIQELFNKAESQDVRLYRTIFIGLCTGMRFGEIVSLTWQEIDFDRNCIFLSRLKTKGKRARVIPIVPKLRQLLLSLKNQDNNKSVVNANYNIIQIQWKKLQPCLSFVNLDDRSKFRFHDLRHITAQYLLDEGADMADLQTILGHQDITTTQRRYAMFARPDLAEKMKRIENILPFKKVSGE